MVRSTADKKQKPVIPSVCEGPGPGGWFRTITAFSSQARSRTKNKRRHPERMRGTWAGRVVPHNEKLLPGKQDQDCAEPPTRPGPSHTLGMTVFYSSAK